LNIAIAIVAYNRPASLRRLLNSLNMVQTTLSIPLYISIDYSGENDVSSVADQFSWKNGEKHIVKHKQRQGLKRHVLSIGKLFEKHDHLIVLEDDLIVAPTMLDFAQKALIFYEFDKNIAGISLYNHKFNVVAKLPFEPVIDGSDVYFMQFASSWGQVWSQKWWAPFESWLQNDRSLTCSNQFVPEFVRSWPNSSWLKLHIEYLVEKGLYFVYPRFGLTTNCNDQGSNVSRASRGYQIPLLLRSTSYRFSKFEQSLSVYDSFFEPIILNHSLVEMPFVSSNFYRQKQPSPESPMLITTHESSGTEQQVSGILTPFETNLHFRLDVENDYPSIVSSERRLGLFENYRVRMELLISHYPLLDGKDVLLMLLNKIFSRFYRIFKG
jgi:hypothetical protein